MPPDLLPGVTELRLNSLSSKSDFGVWKRGIYSQYEDRSRRMLQTIRTMESSVVGSQIPP